MAKRVQLVSQFLESVSREVLNDYRNIIQNYIRGRQGVYALYRRGKLHYVGLASSLSARLKHHLKDGHQKKWDRFSVYLTIGDTSMKEMETLLLRIVDPPGNRVKGKFHRAENLKRLLRADIRSFHNQTLDDIFGRKVTLATKKKAKKKPRRLKNAPKRTPILAGYTDDKFWIRGRTHGKTVRAYVRSDGAIRFRKEIFSSPSVAAAVATQRQTCNGWKFWEYERAPGDWVSLDHLRR